MALDTPWNKVQNVGGIAAFGGLLLLTLLGAARVSGRAATGHPLDPAIGILVGVLIGSAMWVLLAFALRSVIALARR